MKLIQNAGSFVHPNATVEIQICGDSFRATRSGSITNIGARLLDSSPNINSYTSISQFFVIERSDNYENLKSVFNDLQISLINQSTFQCNKNFVVQLNFSFGGDMMFYSECFGLGGVFNGCFNCPWCEKERNLFWDSENVLPFRSYQKMVHLSHSPMQEVSS